MLTAEQPGLTPDQLDLLRRLLAAYREVWFIDTEFNFRPSRDHTFPGYPQSDASIQHPVALVGRELFGGRVARLFEDGFGLDGPPFGLGDDTLFVAYSAAAEWQTFLAAGWELPVRAIDLFFEYRRHICGVPGVDLSVAGNKRLPKALGHFNIPGHTAEEKDEEIALVLRGGPWTPSERERVLTYCESDVLPLPRLLFDLLTADCCGTPLACDPLGVAQAVHRGRTSFAAARSTSHAIPLDTELLGLVLSDWERLKLAAVAEMDTLGVYDEKGSFRERRFLDRMDELGIDWDRCSDGGPVTEAKYFEKMATHYPVVRPLYELHCTLAQLRLDKLAVGADGRNRAPLFPFGTKTGRNAPLSSRFLFGLPHWVRHFIKPGEGMAVAQLDYRSQEYHVAGVLSGDEELLRVVESDDAYMAFAIAAGLAPPGATKQTHPEIRRICKVLLLGTAYGMGVRKFADDANIPLPQAAFLHSRLKRTFASYTRWSSFEVVAEARGERWLHTVYGWRQFMDDSRTTTVRNFPMQATGAEILRLAWCLATERNVRVCAPVHDALFIESPTADIEEAIRLTTEAMEEASAEVLGGHVIPVTVEGITHWPDRFRPDEGAEMWERVLRLVGAQDQGGCGVGVGVGWVSSI